MSEIQVRSCGFILFRENERAEKQFLLMRHPDRWDLPKGHVDPGETQMQCALRELEEETGIKRDDILIDERFRYSQQYVVRYKRTGNKPQLKELVIFLAHMQREVELLLTEHSGFEWFSWDPPHSIQAQTIDPLLAAVAEYEGLGA